MSDDFGADAVDEMAYNFDKWLGTAQGRIVIPEPSTQKVTTFLREWVEVLDRAAHSVEQTEAPKDETPEQRDDRLSKQFAAEELAALQLNDERCRIVSELCSGTPSVDDLTRLPHRVRRGFEGYLQAKLSPEG